MRAPTLDSSGIDGTDEVAHNPRFPISEGILNTRMGALRPASLYRNLEASAFDEEHKASKVTNQG